MLENWSEKAGRSCSVAYQEIDGKELTDSLHQHRSFELCYLLHGEGEWQVGPARGKFRPGTLLVCPPRTLHSWRSDLGNRASVIVIRFSRESLPEKLLELPEMAALRSLFEVVQKAISCEVSDRERLRTRLRSVDRAQGVLRLVRFYVALDLIVGFKSTQVEQDQGDSGILRSRELARLEQVKRLVQERFKEPLSRSAAAKIAGLDESAFSRFFKRATGATFVNYLSSIRTRHAAALLGSRRDLSMDQIATLSGFGSVASLHRQFKKRIGTTPDSYRKAANSEGLAP